jgi:hypothetical protein
VFFANGGCNISIGYVMYSIVFDVVLGVVCI